MADIKDIMGVPKEAAPAQPASKAPKAPKMKRPEGMSREAFALLGDSHPIVASQLVVKKKETKPKPKISTKGPVVWLYKPFKNQARKDGLELLRWCKAHKDANGRIVEAEEGEYAFAKLNKKVQLYRYTDEEYDGLFGRSSGDWTRGETDYLLALCDQFDLRFPVIADRYNYPGGRPRSLDELKERYYLIARKLLVDREGHGASVANNPLVRSPFSAQHEMDRKRAVLELLKRTHAQTQEDNAVLLEAKAIEEKRKAEAAAAAQAAAAAKRQAAAAAAVAAVSTGPMSAPPMPRMSPAVGGVAGDVGPVPAAAPPAAPELRYPEAFPNQLPMGTPSMFDVNVQPYRPRPGVYVRGAHTMSMAVNMMGNVQGGPRALKFAETKLEEVGWGRANPANPEDTVPRSPRVPTRAVCGAWLAMRAEVLAYTELRRQMHTRAGMGDGMDVKDNKARNRAGSTKRR